MNQPPAVILEKQFDFLFRKMFPLKAVVCDCKRVCRSNRISFNNKLHATIMLPSSVGRERGGLGLIRILLDKLTCLSLL